METQIKEKNFVISYSAMSEENKDKFCQIIYSNCASYIKKFFTKYKTIIINALSNKACKDFEKMLKKYNFSLPYLKNLIKTLDNNTQDQFVAYGLAGLFSHDKEIVNYFLKKDVELDKSAFLNYLSRCEDKKKQVIFDACACASFDLNVSMAEIDSLEQKQKLESLVQELNKKSQELEDCKKENKKLDNDIKNKINEINKKDEQITALGEELNFYKNNSNVKQSTIGTQSPTKKQLDTEHTEQLDDKIIINYKDALDDLETRTLIGVVKAEGIRPENPWVIVSPIVPIINDNANINKEEIYKNTEYRSDYNSFLLFLDKRVLRMVLSEEDANNYEYYSNDEKYSCLFEAFCKKILFFVPQFNETDDSEKLKLNAYLIQRPVEYKDFSNSSFVPFYDVTKKRFEDIVKKHENLILENYPYSLSSMLRYIYVGNSIYEINYIPDVIHDNGDNITWKYNSKEGTEPLKKLNINIDTDNSNSYVFVPSAFDQKDYGIYVKNAILMQLSKRIKSIFDENELITNISNSAKTKHLFYKEDDLKNFHIAIKSSNLVILAGPSGTGKTKLPLIYANALGLDAARNTVLFVPISPSYLEPEDVLGYVKPLQNNKDGFNAEFIEAQTGLVSFLIDAQEHKDKIHLVVFDEMNLSQIEHWFAPFISLLEQDVDSRVLNLYSNNLSVSNCDKFSSTISIGENVFFVGTINIDETTKHISDRLLDRAIVINLTSPSFVQLRDMGSAVSEIYQEVSYSRFVNSVASVDNAALEFSDDEFDFINELNDNLLDSSYGKGISFRSLNKIATYLKNSKGILERKVAFDFAIAQMVIQKISGSNEDLKDLLLGDGNQTILRILNAYNDVSDFDRTRKIIKKKIEEIERYGFTR